VKPKRKSGTRSVPRQRSTARPDGYLYNITVTPIPKRSEDKAPLTSDYHRKLQLMARFFTEAFEDFAWSGKIPADVVLLILGHHWDPGAYQLRQAIYRAVELARNSIYKEVDESFFEDLFQRAPAGGISLNQRLHRNLFRVWEAVSPSQRNQLPFIYRKSGGCDPRRVELPQLLDFKYWTIMVNAYIHGMGLPKGGQSAHLKFPDPSSPPPSTRSPRPSSALPAAVLFYPNSSCTSLVLSGRVIKPASHNASTLKFMVEQFHANSEVSFDTTEVDSKLGRPKGRTMDNLRKDKKVFNVIVAKDGQRRVKFLARPDRREGKAIEMADS